MAPSSFVPSADARVRYWRRTRRLTLALLCVWLATTFSVAFFARELSEIDLFGWPLSYYLAGQGAIFMYVIVVLVHTSRMSTIDTILKNEDSGDAK